MTPTVDRTLPGWLLGMLLGAMGTDALAVERMTIGGEGLSWEKTVAECQEYGRRLARELGTRCSLAGKSNENKEA